MRATALSATSSERPIVARRFAAPERVRTPVVSSIQCASRAGTRWTVPRIGHVRSAWGSSSAAVMSPSVEPGSRSPRDHRPLALSCACIAPRCVTTSSTELGAGAELGRGCTSNAAIRIRRT